MPIVQLPDGTSAEFPEGMTPEAIASVIQGHVAQSEKPDRYRGAILPFSQDAEGNNRLDLTAGIPGALWSGFTLPGDVGTGKVPTPYSDKNATTDPIEALARAKDFGMFGANPSTALRAGEVIPGAELTRSLGAPDARTLKGVGGAGFDALRATGAEYDPKAVSELAVRVQNDLTREGFGSKVAPVTQGILDETANPPPLPPGWEDRRSTIDNIIGIRKNLGNVPITRDGAADAKAGGIAREAFDEFLGSVDPRSVEAGNASAAELAKMYRDANGNWSAAQKSNDLTGDLDRANTSILGRSEGRTEASRSGSLDRRIRGRVESLLELGKEITGFSDDELAALKGVRRGGFVRNKASDIGDFFGGGHGLASLISAISAGASSHVLGQNPVTTGLLTAAPPALGAVARGLANKLGRRSINQVDEQVRANSPLNQQMIDQGLLTAPAIGRNSAILRALLPGLLSEQPTPRPASPSDLALLLAGGA